MNLKEILWTRPNEWFDSFEMDHDKFIIFPILPALIINQYSNNAATWFYISLIVIYIIYRLFWLNGKQKEDQTEEHEESEDDYNFTPIFFKSATREHLYDALESAKLSRQLAAAQENMNEFDYWEIVIEDIENLIENYSE